MRKQLRKHRRGMALFWTLGLITVLVAVTGLLAQTFVSAQRESRRREQRLQAELLAAGASSRVAAQIARDSKYAGEAWELDEATSGLDFPAQITITVEPIPEQPTLRSADILVRYGADCAHSVMIEKQIRVSGGKP